MTNLAVKFLLGATVIGLLTGSILYAEATKSETPDCPSNMSFVETLHDGVCISIDSPGCPTGYYYTSTHCVSLQQSLCPSGYVWNEVSCILNQ